MNIIEQATQRLEELQRAGIQVPWDALPPGARQAAGVKREPVEAATVPDAVGEAPAMLPPVTRLKSLPDAASARVAPSSGRSSREVTVDLERLTGLGYLVPGRERTLWADEFRAIKRPILANARADAQKGAPANLVMVTSALPAEGKTFCSINLAMSIASEVDSSVLLVDADVVRPAVLERLGIAGTFPGLLDVIDGTLSDLSKVLLKPNIPKLTILPAGAARKNAAELLASGGMQRLLQDLSQRYPDRIILFDAPPLLLTSESKSLAARMGQLLMVVRQDRTTAQQLAAAFSAVESVPVVMSVLNGATASESKASYSGGYGFYE